MAAAGSGGPLPLRSLGCSSCPTPVTAQRLGGLGRDTTCRLHGVGPPGPPLTLWGLLGSWRLSRS